VDLAVDGGSEEGAMGNFWNIFERSGRRRPRKTKS
jgi:hypothetical protein